MRKLESGLAVRVRSVVLLLAAMLLMAPFAASAKSEDNDTAKAEAKSSAESAAESAKSGEQAAEAQPATKKININKATAKELESLPGIGPALSKRIIEGRPYKTIEDIKKVKGIGEKTFEKIKDKITVK